MMKHILIVISIFVFGLTVKGQEVVDPNRSGMFVDATAGIFIDNSRAEPSLGIGVDGGYRHYLDKGFSWDIVSLGAETSTWGREEFELRLLTGVHYNLPKEIINKSMYAEFALGYCYSISNYTGGFAYNIGAGFNLSKLISLGIIWEGSSKSEEHSGVKSRNNFGIFGVKCGFNF